MKLGAAGTLSVTLLAVASSCKSTDRGLAPTRQVGTSVAPGVEGPAARRPTFYKSVSGDVRMSVQAWEQSGGTSNPANHGQVMRTYKITVDDVYVPTASLVRVDD